MSAVLTWLVNNYTWIFSGIGVALLVGVVGWWLRRRKAEPMDGDSVNVSNSLLDNRATQNASPVVTQQVYVGGAEQKPKEPQEEKEEVPIIDYVQARSVLLREDDFGVWNEAAQNLASAVPGIVGQFRNVPKACASPKRRTPAE